MKNLLLFALFGQTYGVWEDDITSVRDGLTLHRLPLSPDAVAGMALINDRSATFADIGACLGLRAMARAGAIHYFLLGEQEKLAGFAVEGTIGKLPLPVDAVLPMPAFLSTPDVSSCALHAGALIPIVNIKDLYLRVRSGQLEPIAPSLAVPGFDKRAVPSPGEVRAIRSGGETFAVPRAGTEKDIVAAGPVTRLPLVPGFVTGVAPYRGEAIPVIHLGRRMGLPHPGAPADLLIAKIGGSRYGFLIDGDGGPFPSAELAVEHQPPLTRCSWMEAAVLSGGEIIPLIDPAALIALSEAEQNRPPLPERYSLDSAFGDLYLKESAEVAEFVLLGARHALPKSEIADAAPLRGWRPVPNVQPIVIGVTRHDGRLLPVLDLAMIFGRRSIIAPEWRMVLVKNGDFEAFVVTGAVFEPKRIALENQRAVPIVLPHRVVYGCYPDKGTVKLVLNVAALTVHFDKALVKEFIGAISREMAEAPAELVHALLPEEHLARLSPEEAAAARDIEAEAAAAVPAGVTGAASGSETQAPAEAEERSRREEAERARIAAEQAAREAKERTRREAEEQAGREAEERDRAEVEAKAAAEADERARLEAEEAARKEAEEQARREAEERAQAEAAAAAMAEAAAAALREAEDRSRREEAERARLAAVQAAREAEEQARREAEDLARQEAEEKTRSEAEERERAEAEARAAAEAEERARLEAEEAARREAEERARQEAEEQARTEAEEQAQVEAAAVARREAEERSRQEAADRAQAEAEERSRREEKERARIAAAQAAREAEEQARREAEEKARQEAEARSRREAEERARAEAERRAREEAEAVVHEAGEVARASGAGVGVSRASVPYREVSRPVPDIGEKELAEKKRGQRTWSFLIFALAVVIIGLLYFVGVPRQPVMKGEQEERSPIAHQKGENVEPVRPAPAPEAETQEPLVLTVPKDMPVESEVYIVKKGDTLWAISKRFTGNPFNYPRVAKDNKIANADLIFPNQKIRIKRQE